MESWKTERDELVIKSRYPKGITPNHDKYIKAIETHSLTICVGPAGTGKDYLACGLAAHMLANGRIEKIVISRPAIECGTSLGYFPGTQKEKMLYYAAPIVNNMLEFMSMKELANYEKDGRVEILHTGLMRGLTFKNCMVIISEAQNLKYGELKMVLTRIGQSCRMVINGDILQSDLRMGDQNALLKISNQLENVNPDIKIVRMDYCDIVRSELVRVILENLDGEV